MRVQLAGIYERYGLYQQALDQYKQALNSVQMPDSGEGMGSLLAQTVAEGLGRTARWSGRGSEAVPVLAAFVRRASSAGVWNELGMLYDAGKDLEAAEQAYRQALTTAPAGPGADRIRNNLGYNLVLQKRPDEAEAEFRRALALNPKSATAHNNLGAVLAQRGDTDGAFEQFRLATEDVATAHNNLAVVLLELGRYERSRDELIKALASRYYFAPPIENFKLVQELLRQRMELLAPGESLPLRPVLLPAAVASEIDRVELLGEPDGRFSEKERGGELQVSEDGR